MKKRIQGRGVFSVLAASIAAASAALAGSDGACADEGPAAWQRGAVLRGSPDGDVVPPPPPGRSETEALQEVNRIRAQHGLGPIRFHERLYAAAYAHSREQLQANYLGHEARDPARATLGQRMTAEGYVGRMYAEVVARDFSAARDVVQAWMDSPRHREVLLDPDLSEGAFSRVDGASSALNRWTGDFGAPVARYSPTPAPAPAPSVASATPSVAPRVSLPATNAPRSSSTLPQPPAPLPVSRSGAGSPPTSMPPVPAPTPRVLASTETPGMPVPAPRVAAVPPPPAPPASTAARVASPSPRATATPSTQPRVTAPLPPVARVASAPQAQPVPAPRATTAPRSSAPPMVASAPQPYRPAPAPRRQPRRVGDCAT